MTKRVAIKTTTPPKIPERRGSTSNHRFDEMMSVTETGTSVLTSSDSSDNSSDSDDSTDSSDEESV